MRIFKNPKRSQWENLVKRPELQNSGKSELVRDVLEDVRENGDRALRSYTLQFDGADIDRFEITTKFAEIDSDLSKALETARSNIELFHRAQINEPKEIETTPGVSCWQRSTPIETVGIYVPGGTAPLFSTVLMLAIPAQIAGCRKIIMCTPPDENGTINPLISHAAKMCGIDSVYRVGGAQAIAAMAFGTESVPRCDKIFGPGNSFVTLAKQLVSAEGVGIDMPAGPSEVAVLADATANPAFVASDLLAQAEHGTDSQVVLVSDSENLIERSIEETENQIGKLPRRDIAQAALKNSFAILVEDIDAGLEFLDLYAPEHLIISTANPRKVADSVMNAGSVFVGPYSCESAGDYASGTNHTLPTNGFARSFSGVSLSSFTKQITFQELTPEGILNLGPAIMRLAEAEELKAHSEAVAIRINELEAGNEF